VSEKATITTIARLMNYGTHRSKYNEFLLRPSRLLSQVLHYYLYARLTLQYASLLLQYGCYHLQYVPYQLLNDSYRLLYVPYHLLYDSYLLQYGSGMLQHASGALQYGLDLLLYVSYLPVTQYDYCRLQYAKYKTERNRSLFGLFKVMNICMN